ncbi:hypothetical protein F5B19DRAFT_493411 [Rostrohypoxylon terebratum]|nr:hypothetical protein F5B19DRAFT_493411 [Rostrohypoxylon terebratum]
MWGETPRRVLNTECSRGESLHNALPKLTPTDIKRIAGQLREYLVRMRSLTSPVMERWDGQTLARNIALYKPLPSNHWRQYSNCATDSELRLNLSLAIEDNLDLDTMHRFMAKMPSGVPFTFAHGNIGTSSVMVEDGNFVGLTNWKLCGFYPSWWEFVNCCTIMSDQFPPEFGDEDALEWFNIYHAIREWPRDPETVAKLNEYLNRVTDLSDATDPDHRCTIQ